MGKNLRFLLILLIFSTGYSQENIKEVTILHWNDFHAHNLPEKRQKKNSDGETVSYYYGGTSNMLGYINKFRSSNSLVLNAGDDFQGTPISSITRGKSQIELLNLYNLDAFVLGNHEFDYGQFALDSALKLARFDYLSANLYFEPEANTMGKSYVIRERDGIKTGIIGVSLPELYEVTLPKNVNRITVLNTDSVIRSNINKLKEENCDLIVMLTHAGVHNDSIFASIYYKDVDVIVGGHSHTPLFKPFVVSGVLIVQAGSYGRWLGKLDLKVDTDKDTVISYYGQLVETVIDSTIYDKPVQEMVQKMVDDATVELKRVIGKIESDWKASYTVETNLAQFEADAFREAAGTEIGLINGGAVRKSMYKGDVTIGDIWEINPFSNTLVTFSVTGKTLKQMLENNIRIRAEKIKQGESIDIINISGMTYTYDVSKLDAGVSPLIEIKISGKEADDNSIYSIVTNNYVAEQFLKFFGKVPEDIVVKDTGMIDRDVIIEAVEKLKVINSIEEDRIVEITR